MKRLALIAWLLLCLHVTAAEPPKLVIVGPDEPVAPLQMVFLDVTGVDIATYSRGVQKHWPTKGVTTRALVDLDGHTVLAVQCVKEGSYHFLFVMPRLENKLPACESAEYVLTVGEQPDPDPDPVPPPDIKILWSVVVYESDDVDDAYPWLSNILTSGEIRKLTANNCKLLFADKDEVDESGQPPAVTKTWIARAVVEKRTLPWIYLVNQEGDLVVGQPVPKTVAEVVTLIQKYAPPRPDMVIPPKPEPGKIIIKPYVPPAVCPSGVCPTTGRRLR